MSLGGLIYIAGGVYGLLMAYRVVPKNPKDPEKMELWHRKFGKMMKIICPWLVAWGVLNLLFY
tara:strand:- start:84 stop:272 length:189 start_codon:yes stop_codon:yes gene_type:complete